MGFHQFLSLLCFLLFLHSSLPFASSLCAPDQRDALLHFKNSFEIVNSSPICDFDYDATSYPRTDSWNKSTDCCHWDGVTCDSVTGNIIGLDLTCSWLYGELRSNSTLFLLRHLLSLNLAGNDFQASPILPNLTVFEKMTHLNLSCSNFDGDIPNEISQLSKLVSLDLSTYPTHYVGLESSVLTMLAQNLTVLRKLALNSVYMFEISPMSLVNFSSLTDLNVGGCRLRGIVPAAFFRQPSLTNLDMSKNFYLSGILPESNWTSPLESLYLSLISFSGEIPESIGSLKKLTFLDLSGCTFTGLIPSSLGNLKQLQLLDLSHNKLDGKIPKSFWETSHDTLEDLDLSHNLLEGSIPELPWKRLSCINLWNNSLQGPLPIPPPSTSYFLASDNGFTGEIPSSICQMSSLLKLNLSYNNLSGNIPPCFGNLTKFVELDLSNNKLQGQLPRFLAKCMDLFRLDLGHNDFSDIFPHWLEAPNLWSLDLQSNNLYGRIDITSFALSFPALEYLYISNNNFIGRWPTEVFSNSSLSVIDLSNNKFGGPIPYPSPVTEYYSLASNGIRGKIPSWLCNATWLDVVNLSDNDLIGTLPSCFTNWSMPLSVLNLRKNHLEGTIPQLFSSTCELMTLDLSRNRFESTLPRSLVKCKYLEVLDLNNNWIEDTFPTWLGILQELKVLILRSNNFNGLLDIPKGASLFPNLHILDLSNNNFGGPLPANLIMNLKAMMTGENDTEKPLYMTMGGLGPYENSVSVTIKGQDVELVKILTVFTTIDLSRNSFKGDIPEVIGHLHSLIGLNLSYNHFTGSIPLTLGNLADLEWLDLSANKLSGGIPGKLGDLAFLGYLNLSMNHLTGRIPQGRQLSTFSIDSFSGNPGLCGTPLPKACPGDAQPPLPLPSSNFNRKGHESWFKRKVVWIGYASGIVIGISITYIAFETGRPIWLVRRVKTLERRAAEWMKKPKQKTIKFHGQ